MTYREFVAPDECSILDILGVEPEPVEGEDGTGWLYIDFDTDELTGTLTAQVHPTIALHDSMLFA